MISLKQIAISFIALFGLLVFTGKEILAQKYVTIFYSCWANECLNTTYENDVYIMGETPYSPYPMWNWWGKPLYAATTGDGTIKNNYKLYFDSPDNPNNDLIDWHADLLSEAGIDFITLDLTNGTQTKIVYGAKAICKRYQERFEQNLPTPQIVFWVQDSVCLKTVQTEIFDVYSEAIFFEYLGKKLVNVAGDNVQPAIPDEGIFGKYTCRRMWGLDKSGSFWQFKVNSSTPPPPFYFNGKPEQMCAPVATQSTYMTENGVTPAAGAVGRQNGEYFVKYMDAAIAADVKFIFIHSWNEWTAQNLGSAENPKFTDQWKFEYSSDIEPVDGGHGWKYYNLMREKIAEFKNIDGVNENSNSFNPRYLDVEQNYPNPFNHITNIRYSLGRTGDIELSVYDPLGKLLTRDIERDCNPGNYNYTFDANSLSAGIYFLQIRLISENKIVSEVNRKMVYLK